MPQHRAVRRELPAVLDVSISVQATVRERRLRTASGAEFVGGPTEFALRAECNPIALCVMFTSGPNARRLGLALFTQLGGLVL